MPVNQAAASRYESNATADKWRAGVADGDPASGLQDAGVSGLDASRFNSRWREGVDEADYRVDGDAWLSGMRDASDWNY